MNADQLDVSPAKARNERDLLKQLVDLRRLTSAAAPARQAYDRGEQIKSLLLRIKMQAHEGCSAIERDMWLCLYQHELRLTEMNGRKFEDGNFRRRAEALGVVNAAVETVLHFRFRASSKLKGVPVDEVVLRHQDIFGSHLCDLARKNLEIRSLLAALPDEGEDE